MHKPEPEPGFIKFEPWLKFKTPKYNRAWEVLKEMDIVRTTVFCHYDMNITGLGFETKEQAMLFRLKLG